MSKATLRTSTELEVDIPESYTKSLHCSSFLGLPFRILNIELVKPKKGTTIETIGTPKVCSFQEIDSADFVKLHLWQHGWPWTV